LTLQGKRISAMKVPRPNMERFRVLDRLSMVVNSLPIRVFSVEFSAIAEDQPLRMTIRIKIY
jgi:hypothetical protein